MNSILSYYFGFAVGDGRKGYEQDGPYDAIHVGAAAPEVPTALVAQLRPSGRLIVPVGPEGRDQEFLQVGMVYKFNYNS